MQYGMMLKKMEMMALAMGDAALAKEYETCLLYTSFM